MNPHVLEAIAETRGHIDAAIVACESAKRQAAAAGAGRVWTILNMLAVELGRTETLLAQLEGGGHVGG